MTPQERGRKGGSRNSPAQQAARLRNLEIARRDPDFRAAARRNGQLGGRPRGDAP